MWWLKNKDISQPVCALLGTEDTLTDFNVRLASFSKSHILHRCFTDTVHENFGTFEVLTKAQKSQLMKELVSCEYN